MLHDSIDTSLLPTFPPEVLEEVKREGRIRALQPGEALFTEGQPDPDFFFVLSGEVRITRQQEGEEQVLAVHQPGEFAGELSLLTGGPARSTGRAMRPARVLQLRADAFRRMVMERSPLAKFALQAVVARHQEVEARVREQEKLAALGRMAASLTHELNNPAAAARRAADQLREESLAAQHRALSQERRLTEPQRKALTELVQALLVAPPQVQDALARSELEDALLEWLGDHGLQQAFSRASIFASAGMDVPHLDELGTLLEGPALQAGLTWLEATLSLAELGNVLVASTDRLTSLIAAVKQYTYQDQGTLQEVDLHSGLEATLAMLAHRMRGGVAVTRDYDTSLPKLWAHGSELNQVWTNLIENALDAMKDRGTLLVSTSRRGDEVHVEIGDDGPGIPEELQARIWEPFFTTKLLGQGTGLGLDIALRIVERHFGGRIHLQSKPGDTRFRVELPLKPELPH
ncbi:sensor histidine kinase [Hyalangium sp.]|uniref:sensor histidine kinase n=1 Tax=Hyalangium sp. TaxID=2028555 RepID=UPI002D2EBC76|nr:ATP-binding protein [Hyalangium sp.]HYH96864.1 ATP-binding protein [Hyalangium sp.]